MASNNKLAAAIFVLSVLLSTTMSSACGSCNPSPHRPPAATPPPATAYCPTNTLKLGACAGVLGTNVAVGSPPYSQCCAILGGLGEVEAALCLCLAIKANVLGIQLNWPTNIGLILSLCNRPIPAGFKCA